MTQLQQILWKLEMDYIGRPYYVSGHAIRSAIGRHCDVASLPAASHGMFVPGQFGRFPDAHSQTGTYPYLGGTLPAVTAYDDLFLHREPAQPWLLESRARDALNVHGLRRHGGRLALANRIFMGRQADQHADYRTTPWYIHAYLHADDTGPLPLDAECLEGLRFGGKRTYGYGAVTLQDTQVVDLEEIDFSRLEDAPAYRIELVTPVVLTSDAPTADDRSVPWWWAADRDALRCREEQLIVGGERLRLQTIDHGQTVEYCGDRPVATAKNGITRIGTHAQYGFGELRVQPVASTSAADDVSEHSLS